MIQHHPSKEQQLVSRWISYYLQWYNDEIGSVELWDYFSSSLWGWSQIPLAVSRTFVEHWLCLSSFGFVSNVLWLDALSHNSTLVAFNVSLFFLPPAVVSNGCSAFLVFAFWHHHMLWLGLASLCFCLTAPFFLFVSPTRAGTHRASWLANWNCITKRNSEWRFKEFRIQSSQRH